MVGKDSHRRCLAASVPLVTACVGFLLVSGVASWAHTGANSTTSAQAQDARFGPSLQFDARGVEIGSWVRGFIQQVRMNWLMPSDEGNGHVVLTFYVSKDGALWHTRLHKKGVRFDV